jgi:hypothetical protein
MISPIPDHERTNVMRFMMMVKGNNDYEAGIRPKKELMEAVIKHATELARAGVLVGTGGLMPSVKGARIMASGGNLTVIDGPFAEAKELIGGYGILKADSKEEAIKLGKIFMQIHVDVLGPAYEGELEIRQMQDDPQPGEVARSCD